MPTDEIENRDSWLWSDIALKKAQAGQRVLLIVPKGKRGSVTRSILERAGGAWPIGLRVEEMK